MPRDELLVIMEKNYRRCKDNVLGLFIVSDWTQFSCCCRVGVCFGTCILSLRLCLSRLLSLLKQAVVRFQFYTTPSFTTRSACLQGPALKARKKNVRPRESVYNRKMASEESVAAALQQDLARLVEWTPEQQVQGLKQRVSNPTDLLKGPVSFVPRPSDVIVATTPKCGTTWLLHICHQLRMQGAEPDFEEQEDVTVWIEKSQQFFGVDPNTKLQPAEPRVFWSHLLYELVPKGGKLIYCFRDQKDALYSLFWFYDGMFALRGRVPLPIFAQHVIASGFIEKTLNNLLVWWEHRHDDNILLLFFDDLKEDHAGCVRRIAKFTGIECSEAVLERVVHTTTHSEMARHHSKFASRSVATMFAKMFGEEPPTDLSGRVRRDGGKSGDGKALPPEVQQQIEEKWKEIVTAKLGFKNLKEMRDAWQKEHQYFCTA